MGEAAQFDGLIRKDPIDKQVIVVGNLSCNSSRTPGPRPQMIENLIKLDPDLLFFAGDQSYHHTEHTYGWLEFGIQFRDVLKNRPVITIPDDHDVGQANIWGENGKQATNSAGPERRLLLSTPNTSTWCNAVRHGICRIPMTQLRSNARSASTTPT